jgi:hypothetical protein
MGTMIASTASSWWSCDGGKTGWRNNNDRLLYRHRVDGMGRSLATAHRPKAESSLWLLEGSGWVEWRTGVAGRAGT